MLAACCCLSQCLLGMRIREHCVASVVSALHAVVLSAARCPFSEGTAGGSIGFRWDFAGLRPALKAVVGSPASACGTVSSIEPQSASHAPSAAIEAPRMPVASARW